MKPLPPGRFSTTNCQLRRSVIFDVRIRAVVSTAPPGANGTRMRIGFDG